MVPHLGVEVQAAVVVLAHVVVLRHAGRLHDDVGVVKLGKLRNPDRLDLPDQVHHPGLPALVEPVPVLVVVTGPPLERLEPALDLGGIGDRYGRYVNPPVDDPVLDAERGGEAEHPRGVRADRGVRDLRRHHVEGRHRLGEVHRVVEPETVVVLGLEPGEVRVHRPPAFGARHISDLRGEREAAGGAFCIHGSSFSPSGSPAASPRSSRRSRARPGSPSHCGWPPRPPGRRAGSCAPVPPSSSR